MSVVAFECNETGYHLGAARDHQFGFKNHPYCSSFFLDSHSTLFFAPHEIPFDFILHSDFIVPVYSWVNSIFWTSFKDLCALASFQGSNNPTCEMQFVHGIFKQHFTFVVPSIPLRHYLKFIQLHNSNFQSTPFMNPPLFNVYADSELQARTCILPSKQFVGISIQR